MVFRVRRSFEASPHSGREGESLLALLVEEATLAPAIWTAGAYGRVCGECPTPNQYT